MIVLRLTALVLASTLVGIGYGALLGPQADAAPPAAIRAPVAAPEPMPVEAPVRATKQARLDAVCAAQTWPYIASDCLERVAAAPRRVEPSVTVETRDLANATSTLTRTPLVRTASR